jgi:hypothetical protein
VQQQKDVQVSDQAGGVAADFNCHAPLCPVSRCHPLPVARCSKGLKPVLIDSKKEL